MAKSSIAKLVAIRSLVAIGLSMAVLPGAHAQQVKFDEEILSALITSQEVLTYSLQQDTKLESYIAATLFPIRNFDRDMDGLDKVDLAREYARRATGRRLHEIDELLRFDYDGDYTVTRAEIIEYSRDIDAIKREQEADRIMARFDRDGDGVATPEEVTKVNPEEEQSARARFENGLLSLDPDNDGKLTVAELTMIAKKVFDHFDQNKNGRIDKREYRLFSQYQQEKRIRKQLISKGCNYPAASAGAELVLFSTRQSKVLADAWVGNPSVVTGIADVIIEPGQVPLYLILDSYASMIWRFTGATSRIERVVASSFESHERRLGSGGQDWPLASAVSAIGIDEDRFHDLPAECLTNGENNSYEHRNAADRIALLIGRSAMNVIASQPFIYKRVVLTQGTAPQVMPREIPAPEGFDANMWRDAIGYNPGGLEHVDPASLVTSEAVGAYKVLPKQFGLAQLLGSGVLKRSKHDLLLLTDAIPYWPAGLTRKFVVKDGVELPEGDPGYSCVLTEAEAAEPSWDQICRDRVLDRDRKQKPSPLKHAPIWQELSAPGIIVVTG